MEEEEEKGKGSEWKIKYKEEKDGSIRRRVGKGVV